MGVLIYDAELGLAVIDQKFSHLDWLLEEAVMRAKKRKRK